MANPLNTMTPTVTLTGYNFGSAAPATGKVFTVTYGPTGLEYTATSPTWSTATAITCVLTAASLQSVARFRFIVTVDTAVGTVGGVVFWVDPILPTISGVNPSAINLAASPAAVTVTLVGDGFGDKLGSANDVLTVNYGPYGIEKAATGVAWWNRRAITAVIPLGDVSALNTYRFTVSAASGNTAATPLTVFGKMNQPSVATFQIVSATTPVVGSVWTSLNSTTSSNMTALATAPSAGLLVTLTGTNFGAATSTVVVKYGTGETPDQTATDPTWVSATVITAKLLPASLTSVSALRFTVTVATVTTPVSGPLYIILPAMPVITSVTPSFAVQGATATTITIFGSNLGTAVPMAITFGAIGYEKSCGLSTTVPSTSVTCTIAASDLTATGVFKFMISAAPVTQFGQSLPSSATFQVISATTPTISGVAPASTNAGATSAFTVTLTGTNYGNTAPAAGSLIVYYGPAGATQTYTLTSAATASPATWVSNTTVTAQLTVASLASATTFYFQVKVGDNTSPASSGSSGMFTVNAAGTVTSSTASDKTNTATVTSSSGTKTNSTGTAANAGVATVTFKLTIDCTGVYNSTASYTEFLTNLKSDMIAAVKAISSDIDFNGRFVLVNVTCGSVVVSYNVLPSSSSTYAPQNIVSALASQAADSNSAFRKGATTGKYDTTYGFKSQQVCNDGSVQAVGSCPGYTTNTGSAANVSMSVFSILAAALFAWAAQKL
jgi:hypothetical protein